jgi:MFS family permease
MRGRLFSEENRKVVELVAVSFGLFMIMLDNTVVNVALPSIRTDLHISTCKLEWVVNAYALTFGVLLLSGGQLADLLGRRAIFHPGRGIGSAVVNNMRQVGGSLGTTIMDSLVGAYRPQA